jgi:hypothetical protein
VNPLGKTVRGRNQIAREKKRGQPPEWRKVRLRCGHDVERSEPDVVKPGVRLFFCPAGCGLQGAR